MSSIKSPQRNRDKAARKEANKKLKALERIVNVTEKKCKICSQIFDPKVPGALDTWMIQSGQNGAYFFCPDCFQKMSDQDRT